MKRLAIAAMIALMPLSACATYTAGAQAQSASSAAQFETRALIVATASYTASVNTIALLVTNGVLKGATLQKVLVIRDRARKALDDADAHGAIIAVGDLALAVGSN